MDLSQVGQITKRFKSSSAAVPALFLAGITIPVGVSGALVAEGAIAQIFGWLAVAGFVLPSLQIAYFSIVDRDRLQNEEHVEKKLLIAAGKAVVGDKDRIIDIEPKGDLIENPNLKGISRVS